MSNNTAPVDRAMQEVFFERYPMEAIACLEQMDVREATEQLVIMPVHRCLKLWERLSPEFGAQLLRHLPGEYVTALMKNLDPNRAAGFLRSMDGKRRAVVLDTLEGRHREDLNRAIAYPAGSAGALMDTRIMFLRPEMTVEEALEILRKRSDQVYRKLYTVDGDNRIHGVLDIGELAIAKRNSRLAELERTQPAAVNVMADREELVQLFEKYRTTDLPVVDFDGRLLGVLRHHVLIGAALEESSADMQTMVGASKEERALSPALFATKKRLPWLHINLITAFTAASVVGLFEGTIAQYTALAILMPVVAGEAGNTGQQALAVTMRGLALKEIYPRMWNRVLMKEFSVGLMNGLVIALVTATAVFVWSQSGGLALIIAIAMLLSMAMATVAGAAIPILLTVAGQDPAQSSSIFLTTITDIAGFFSFLGIATLFIALL